MRAPADRSSATKLLPSVVGECGASFSDTVHLAEESSSASGLQPACRVYDTRHFKGLRSKWQVAPRRGAKRATRFPGPMACVLRNILRTAGRHDERPAACLSREASPPWPGMKLLVRHAGGELTVGSQKEFLILW